MPDDHVSEGGTMVEPGSDAEKQTEDEIPADDSQGSEESEVNLFDDIFAEDDDEDSERLKAFADLEQLTMIEVAAETEAVLEELKMRQGD